MIEAFRVVTIVTAFVGLQAVRADVTVRYESDFKVAEFLPSGIAPGPLQPPQPRVVKFKGTKAYASFGGISSVMEVDSKELTLIDLVHRKFVRASLQDYTDRIQSLYSAALNPGGKPASNSTKATVSSRKTGRMEVIQGVASEETELTCSIQGQLPPPVENDAPLVRMVMQFWIAQPEEALRNPAVRQIAGYGAYRNTVVNPAEILEAMSNVPGCGKDLISQVQDLQKTSLLITRTHVEVSSPILAKFAPLMAQQGHPFPADFDANAPIVVANTEIVEISTAAIDDSAFEIPADFETAPLDEVLQPLITPPAPAVPTVAHGN